MPYDITTTLGYSVTLAIEIIGVLIIGGMICLVDSLFLAMCWYHQALVDDLATVLRALDRNWVHGKGDISVDTFDEMERVQHKSSLIEFVRFNCEIFR